MAKQTLQQAVAMVPAYVEPRDCFVEFAGNAAGYHPMPGTPCAHYVSHALGLKSRAGTGGYGCDKGFELRVRPLLQLLTEVKVDDVRVNDVWARLKGDSRSNAGTSSGGGAKEPTDHCGLVVTVDRSGPTVDIQIRHDSSAQQAVALNSWDHFDRGGKFYRPANAGALPASIQSNLNRVQQGLPLRSE